MTNAPHHRVDEREKTGVTGTGVVAEFTPNHPLGMPGLRLVVDGRAIAGASFVFLQSLLSIDGRRLDPHLRVMCAYLKRRFDEREKNHRRIERTFWSGNADD